MYTGRVIMASQRARVVRAWREGRSAPWDAVLIPLALAYRSALAIRRVAYASGLLRSGRLPCRVVAVGNLTVGGTGKTPLVEHLARSLRARGRRVVILSRGYGRRASEAVSVVSDGARVLLDAGAAGDEPALLARRLHGVPVVVGRDRHRAGMWLMSRFCPDVVLLDDGFQHMRLHKDLEVVCLDARAPWGRGGLLPRGSLREPRAALRRADLLVLTHAVDSGDTARLRRELRTWVPHAPVALAEYEPEGCVEVGSGRVHAGDAIRGRPCLTFAGIAIPEDFAATVTGAGGLVRDFVAFPDHHAYTVRELAALEARARHVGAHLLVTTEKDAVRLPPVVSMPVWVFRVRLRLWGEEPGWWTTLESGTRGRS
jgi:tetraacyldisaccharide 4'-kinase